MVYLKPDNGLKGRGIMRAKKSGTTYELRKETSTAMFDGVQSLYLSVRRQIRRKPYLVQKGIRTLRYHGRSFDFRIMVQINEENEWEVTGIVGRVAPPKRIVTNRSQGGECLPAKLLLQAHMSESEIHRYLGSLSRLCQDIGKQFHRHHPRVRQLGVDIAISKNMKPWILEVNTSPAITPFVELGNKRMYNRIMQLKRLHD